MVRTSLSFPALKVAITAGDDLVMLYYLQYIIYTVYDNYGSKYLLLSTSLVNIIIGILPFFNKQYCGHTALTFACLREDLTSISALLKLGANPNVCTQVCIESSMDGMCATFNVVCISSLCE